MSITADRLFQLVEEFRAEDDKFDGGNNAAGTRARKALMDIRKLCDDRRKTIQAKKNKG